jgi:hypothetical protein
MKKIILLLVIFCSILSNPNFSFAEYVVPGGPTDPNSNYTPRMDTLSGTANSYTQQNWSGQTPSGTPSQNSSGYVTPYSGTVMDPSSFGNTSWQTQGQWDATTNAPRATVVTGDAPRATVVTGADAASYNQGMNSLGSQNQQGASPSQAQASGGACVGQIVGGALGQLVGGGMAAMFATPGALVTVPGNDVQQAGSNYKETILDSVAYCIANMLLESMTASIVSWINNGFKNPDGTSGPGFITNPEEFFKQMADREVGSFFQGLGPIGNLVCKPFDLQIRLALLNDYNQMGNMNQCTLTSIKDNLDNFGNGQNGYMGDWFELTQNSNNNAIGSYFNQRQKLSEAIVYDAEQNRLEVDIGKGFLSFKKCVAYSTTKVDPNTRKAECTKWETTTPGAEVQATIDRTFGAKTSRLALASSFNQIVGALVNQLIVQAMAGLRDTDSGGYGDTTPRENYDFASQLEKTTPVRLGPPPTIYTLNPSIGSATTTITIKGNHFSTSSRNTIKFGKKEILNVASVDGKTLEFKVPENMGAGVYFVSVTSDEVESEYVPFSIDPTFDTKGYTYENNSGTGIKVLIDSLTNNKGDAGDIIHIFGKGFTKDSNKVILTSQGYTSKIIKGLSSSSNGTRLEFVVPDIQKLDYILNVVNENGTSSAVMFKVKN